MGNPHIQRASCTRPWCADQEPEQVAVGLKQQYSPVTEREANFHEVLRAVDALNMTFLNNHVSCGGELGVAAKMFLSTTARADPETVVCSARLRRNKPWLGWRRPEGRRTAPSMRRRGTAVADHRPVDVLHRQA